jgi:cytochrome c5
MNPPKKISAWIRMVLAAGLIGGLASLGCAGTPADSAAANTATVQASAPAAAVVPARKKLTGAELYSIHCNRCHPERYPTERTAAQWKTIMLHMQVRANLPGSQARLILGYLQENSGR